jgi:hypothetical protein
LKLHQEHKALKGYYDNLDQEHDKLVQKLESVEQHYSMDKLKLGSKKSDLSVKKLLEIIDLSFKDMLKCFIINNQFKLEVHNWI